MSTARGQTRIITRGGANYLVKEDMGHVQGLMEKVDEAGAFLELTNVPGQTAFPPEALCIRADEIVTIQTVSAEAWVWQRQVEERHYAQALATSPQEQIAEAQTKLAEWLAEQGGRDD